jgi:ankyrin repeat protein
MAKFLESDPDGNFIKNVGYSTVSGIIESARRTNDAQKLGEILLHCANFGHDAVMRELLDESLTTVDFADDATGLTALHIAVGMNHLGAARLLVERGASFLPDKRGRMPTTVAAECEVSDAMCDFIAEAEAKAEGV